LPSALLATQGAATAASPLAAAFLKNVLRFMLFPSQPHFHISNLKFQISNFVLQPEVAQAVQARRHRIGKAQKLDYFFSYLLKFRGPTSAPYTFPAASAATPS